MAAAPQKLLTDLLEKEDKSVLVRALLIANNATVRQISLKVHTHHSQNHCAEATPCCFQPYPLLPGGVRAHQDRRRVVQGRDPLRQARERAR